MCAGKHKRIGELKIGWGGEFPPHTHFRQCSVGASNQSCYMQIWPVCNKKLAGTLILDPICLSAGSLASLATTR